MTKRTKHSPRLPREVLVHIAQFVPDEATFFAYIDALKGTTSARGPFAALWSLAQSTPHSMLWPSLELHAMGADEWELSVEAIPLYATVKMHARNDLHRLVDRVNPSTNLIIVHKAKPDKTRMREWFRHLARLPVRELDYSTSGNEDCMPTVIPHLVNVWPSLAYLRRLELAVGDQDSLESICQCIGTSQISDLRLHGLSAPGVDRYISEEANYLTLQGNVFSYLVAWLQSTKVVRLHLNGFCCICDDEVSMQALNRALAASDAMQRLVLLACVVRISAPLILPPRLQNLKLRTSFFPLVGIACIWKQLPALPDLTAVSVISSPMSPNDVDVLASVLALSNVSHLDLTDCSIGDGGHFDDCIQRLADAFEASASVRKLILTSNQLCLKGVKAFIVAVERRPHETEMVNAERNISTERLAEWEALLKLRVPPNSRIRM